MEQNRMSLKSIGSSLKKLRYPALILLLGVGLLLWPSKSAKQEPEAVQSETMEAASPEADIQTQMEEILSCIDGAGRVRVLLTRKTGDETIYQTDKTQSSSADGAADTTVTTVMANQSGGGEEPVASQVIYGQYQGAVVVCEGADRAAVRLELVNAVAGLTGLSTDRITVIKMKS